MAITIVATEGSSIANSFVTEAEAIAYAAARLNLSGWTTVSGSAAAENEKKALIEATRDLDLLSFKGRRLMTTQRLSWPRAYALKDEDEPLDAVLVNYGMDLYYTGIPQRLKDATTELAFEFLRAGTEDIAAAPDSRVMIRRKVDVLETEWEPSQGSVAPVGLARFPRVANQIAPLLAGTGNKVVRT